MSSSNEALLSAAEPPLSCNRVGFYTALLTVIITLITFGFALIAIPISGANCPENCITYPYLDTIAQFPRDFLWMAPAMVLLLVYVGLMAAIHVSALTPRKVFSQIGLAFAIIAAVILLIDYYVQFFVVPMSLMNGETEGIPLLIQYNPHGIFIALEELGYIMMGLSFILMAPVFTCESRLSASIRWVFILSFVINLIAFVAIMAIYGMDRLDRFEVIVISVNWLVLILNGGLLSAFFRKRIQASV